VLRSLDAFGLDLLQRSVERGDTATAALLQFVQVEFLLALPLGSLVRLSTLL
jgi:hypothetical protein